ncbi:MAG: glycogen debranching enzyme family protein [Planctomycetes bacterium]|nr:glycogen debranching enzyme family protein [Planctomycetota bacterium]MCB9872501.1 glycogen debranching enzyme family protein [Planctomycetota bacterium]
MPTQNAWSAPQAGAVPPHRDPPAEWLLTDGRGGYAAGTPSLLRTRRYHGLLVAPRPGTAVRHLYFAGFTETVGCRGERVSSATAQGGIDPVAFAARPFVRAVLECPGGQLVREIRMLSGRHAVLVRYSRPATAAREPLALSLGVLLPFRPADHLTVRNDVLQPDTATTDCGLRWQCYPSLPPLDLAIATDGAWGFRAAPTWHTGLRYSTDLARGYDGSEDVFSPGTIEIELGPGQEVVLAATIDGPIPEPRGSWHAAEGDPAGCSRSSSQESRALRPARGVAAPSRLLASEPHDSLTPAWKFDDNQRASVPGGVVARCVRAADDFLYTDAAGRRGVLAGFPWFGEWGRDTFLALPGLTLARGDRDGCAEVLHGAVPFLVDGLLPNIFGAGVADSHYGSVDAALWFARAVLLFDRAGGDPWPLRGALQAIADGYATGAGQRGAALGIRVDEHGLVHAGTPDLNPTWMDAKPASGAVTPRHGCPVEIQALWYSLLRYLAELGERFGDASFRRFAPQAERAGRAFLDRFWLPEPGYLADVWRDGVADCSVRPNMVLAASLELSPLSRAQRAGVLARAETDLWTPRGLRTLAPDHPDYCPRYGGGPEERDRAYHQGTVWPWLLGCFCELALRVDAEEAVSARLRAWIDGFAPELQVGGLEHIAEVFDGDPPHGGGGTFAQAWNTGELLRAAALIEGTLPLARAAE